LPSALAVAQRCWSTLRERQNASVDLAASDRRIPLFDTAAHCFNPRPTLAGATGAARHRSLRNLSVHVGGRGPRTTRAFRRCPCCWYAFCGWARGWRPIVLVMTLQRRQERQQQHCCADQCVRAFNDSRSLGCHLTCALVPLLLAVGSQGRATPLGVVVLRATRRRPKERRTSSKTVCTSAISSITSRDGVYCNTCDSNAGTSGNTQSS
jgi:hypothetical protein